MRHFCYRAISSQDQSGHRCCILQREVRDLGGIQNSHIHQIPIFAIGTVVAEVTPALDHPVQYYRGLLAAIGDDLTQGCFKGVMYDPDPGILVQVGALQPFQCCTRSDQCIRPHRARYLPR